MPAAASSSLHSLFGASSSGAPSVNALSFQRPAQPAPKVAAPAPAVPPSADTPSSSATLHAALVHVYHSVDNQWQDRGQSGLALVGGPPPKPFQIVLYEPTEKKPFSITTVSASVALSTPSVQYVSIVDDRSERWSIYFGKLEDASRFLQHITIVRAFDAIAKANGGQPVAAIVQDVVPGDGHEAAAGDQVGVQFVGWQMPPAPRPTPVGGTASPLGDRMAGGGEGDKPVRCTVGSGEGGASKEWAVGLEGIRKGMIRYVVPISANATAKSCKFYQIEAVKMKRPKEGTKSEPITDLVPAAQAVLQEPAAPASGPVATSCAVDHPSETSLEGATPEDDSAAEKAALKKRMARLAQAGGPMAQMQSVAQPESPPAAAPAASVAPLADTLATNSVLPTADASSPPPVRLLADPVSAAADLAAGGSAPLPHVHCADTIPVAAAPMTTSSASAAEKAAELKLAAEKAIAEAAAAEQAANEEAAREQAAAQQVAAEQAARQAAAQQAAAQQAAAQQAAVQQAAAQQALLIQQQVGLLGGGLGMGPGMAGGYMGTELGFGSSAGALQQLLTITRDSHTMQADIKASVDSVARRLSSVSAAMEGIESSMMRRSHSGDTGGTPASAAAREDAEELSRAQQALREAEGVAEARAGQMEEMRAQVAQLEHSVAREAAKAAEAEQKAAEAEAKAAEAQAKAAEAATAAEAAKATVEGSEAQATAVEEAAMEHAKGMAALRRQLEQAEEATAAAREEAAAATGEAEAAKAEAKASKAAVEATRAAMEETQTEAEATRKEAKEFQRLAECDRSEAETAKREAQEAKAEAEAARAETAAAAEAVDSAAQQTHAETMRRMEEAAAQERERDAARWRVEAEAEAERREEAAAKALHEAHQRSVEAEAAAEELRVKRDRALPPLTPSVSSSRQTFRPPP